MIRRCRWRHPYNGIRCARRRRHDIHSAPFGTGRLLWGSYGSYREGVPK